MPHKASSIVANVRAELARAGLSQRQLADDLGLDRGQMNRRLVGEVAFRADELANIARHLRIPITRLYEAPDGEQAETAEAAS